MKHDHTSRPVTSPAVPPESPGNGSQFGMSRFFSQVEERFSKSRIGTISRITPHLAICLLRLFIGWCHQSTIVFASESLPMQIIGTGQPRLAGTFPATMLMNNDPPQFFDAWWNPYRVLHGKNQFARLL